MWAKLQVTRQTFFFPLLILKFDFHTQNSFLTGQNSNMIDNVRKCKNFMATLLKLASNQRPETIMNVRDLIQGLIVSKSLPLLHAIFLYHLRIILGDEHVLETMSTLKYIHILSAYNLDSLCQ